MICSLITTALFAISPTIVADDGQRLEGIVVNGTHDEVLVTGAEVVLRAGSDAALEPVAKTVTDRDGRFVFDNLPVEPGLIYLPGANHDGIHYPGGRFRSPLATPATPVKLTVFDALAAPNPLVAERHEIDVQVKTAVLTITETLVVHNPSLTTYVGAAGGDSPHETLALAVAPGFERVTFASEFHGRRFKVVDQRLVTDIPWTPGKRQLEFTYNLPLQAVFERRLDLPSSLVRVCVRGEHTESVRCNLPRATATAADALVFESANAELGAGHKITLELNSVSAPWIVNARYGALAVLGGLIVVTIGFLKRRKPLTVSIDTNPKR
jgi:hypothetical protein